MLLSHITSKVAYLDTFKLETRFFHNLSSGKKNPNYLFYDHDAFTFALLNIFVKTCGKVFIIDTILRISILNGIIT